jgi:competence protein ComGF
LNAEYPFPSDKFNCFEKLEATECKDIKVVIKYKLVNSDPENAMTIQTKSEKTQFMFDDEDITSQVEPQLQDGVIVEADESAIFKYKAIINTCDKIHYAAMVMKLKPSDSEKSTDRCKF